MKRFLMTHAGKGTAGIYLASLLIFWPPALSWMAAAAAIVFSLREFRESFRQIDGETVERSEASSVDATVTVNLAAQGESHVPAVFVEERSAQAATPERVQLPEWLQHLPA